MIWKETLDYLSATVLFGNSLLSYIWFLVTFLGFLVVLKILQAVVLRRLEVVVSRTDTDIDNIVLRVVQTVKPPFYLFLALYFALRLLKVDPFFERIVNVVLVCWAALQSVFALQVGFDAVFTRRIKSETHRGHQSILEVARSLMRFVLWTTGILFVLSNLGININSLIAGLGIGGIAIALASQNILSDLFNSLVIYFDQPFAPGDFIKVGEDKGTVQKIGIKTTRIKALSGEEIIIPNRDIAAARIKNYKRLTERRVAFDVAVKYTTAFDHLQKVPSLIQGVIEAVPHTRFDRAHLHQLGDSNMLFSVVYYVTDDDYNLYMDVHQKVLLGILSTLSAEGVATAFPTHTTS